MRPLVVLRPEPGATATCEAAARAGLQAIAAPLFCIEPVAWAAPDPGRFDGLLLTSANAIGHGGPGLKVLRGLPVYAVGEASAEQARNAGFVVSFTGTGGVADLLASIGADLRLLHLCGEHRAPAGTPTQSIMHLPVYRSAELADADVSAIGGAVVAVHSPRAGARLAELAARAGVDISTAAIAAISREAARAAGPGWAQVAVAHSPRDDALLALAARLCNITGRS